MVLRRVVCVRTLLLMTAVVTLGFLTGHVWLRLRYPYSFRRWSLWGPSNYPYQLRGSDGDYWEEIEKTADQMFSKLDRNLTPINYDVMQPYNDANFECVRTRTSPSITTCIFNVWRDVFISRSLQSDGMWEPYVVEEFIDAVKRNDISAGVLDVGANIGFYSLLAAKLGRSVVAVEPMIDSIQRLHRASQIDGTAAHIRVIHNAVADRRTQVTLRASGDNQGDAKIDFAVKECTGTCPTIANTIILDDLVSVVPFSRAVLKIDIQGYEHQAFQRALRLFEAVHFTHIFMEWEIMRDFYVAANHTSTDKNLVERMIHFLFRRNFRPYELVYYGGDPLDPNVWGSWPVEIVWHRMLNVDEKKRVYSSHFKNWPR